MSSIRNAPRYLYSRLRSGCYDVNSIVLAFNQKKTLWLCLHSTGTVFIPYIFVTDQVRLHCTGSKLFLFPFPSTLYWIHYVFCCEHAHSHQSRFTAALPGTALEVFQRGADFSIGGGYNTIRRYCKWTFRWMLACSNVRL